jgi:hypothetical protein
MQPHAHRSHKVRIADDDRNGILSERVAERHETRLRSCAERYVRLTHHLERADDIFPAVLNRRCLNLHERWIEDRSTCTISLSRQHRRQALRQFGKLNRGDCGYAGWFSIRCMVDLRIDHKLEQLFDAGLGGDCESHRHRRLKAEPTRPSRGKNQFWSMGRTKILESGKPA